MSNNKKPKKKIKTWHGFLFKEFDRFCSNFKYFFHFHENLFEVTFLLIYLIEQVSLVYLFYFGKYDVKLVVGIFTLLVLFTISFEKILLKMRNKKHAEKKTNLEKSFYEKIISFQRDYNDLANQANQEVNDWVIKYNLLVEEYNKLKNKKSK